MAQNISLMEKKSSQTNYYRNILYGFVDRGGATSSLYWSIKVYQINQTV